MKRVNRQLFVILVGVGLFAFLLFGSGLDNRAILLAEDAGELAFLPVIMGDPPDMITRTPTVSPSDTPTTEPTDTATATPPMLPIPTVPETAVASAWKCDTSPG